MSELLLNSIIISDAYKCLQQMPDGSVHCIVTSPPYWGLRDYKVEPVNWPKVEIYLFGMLHTIPEMVCCLGLESNPIAYVAHLVLIFREARRVLRKDGTLWLNIGDSYAGSGKAKGDKKERSYKQDTNRSSSEFDSDSSFYKDDYIKPKDLVGIPWMLAFALRDSGWYLRQDIIWNKPNPMPESIKDRCTKAHEYIFLFSNSRKYYFDHTAIMQDYAASTLNDKRLYDDTYEPKEIDVGYPGGNIKGNGLLKRRSGNKKRKSGSERGCPDGTGSNVNGNVPWEGFKANKRDVWTVVKVPFKGAHFATYPEPLIVDCIKAGTSEYGCCASCGKPYIRVVKKGKAIKQAGVPGGNRKYHTESKGRHGDSSVFNTDTFYESVTDGWEKQCKCKSDIVVPCVVMDMFSGSDTTGVVAFKTGRNFILADQNERYVYDISLPRLRETIGVLGEVSVINNI